MTKRVILGDNCVLSGARAGTAIIDMNSIAPAIPQTIAAACETKLANQIIVAANIEAVGEVLVLVRKAGLDPSVVFEAIRSGLAGSNVLNAKAPMMIAGNFDPGFRIRLHQKDLNNALLTGKELGVPLPVTALVQQMIGALVVGGKGDRDHSAIATFIEDMAATKIQGD